MVPTFTLNVNETSTPIKKLNNNYHKINREQIKMVVQNMDWGENDSSLTLSIRWQTTQDGLVHLIDMFVPMNNRPVEIIPKCQKGNNLQHIPKTTFASKSLAFERNGI